jgi:hypothetical protein
MSPIPPAAPPSIPFDTVDAAMNSARVRFNDTPLALSGNLLADTQPYAQTIYNNAWRTFQRDLAEFGDPACTEETILTALPVVASIDPATQYYISQQYVFDGQNFFSAPYVPLLPQDLICPLHLKERLAGTQQLFTPMWPCDNGVPLSPKTTYMRWWEWRSAGPGNGLAIYMTGATVSRDIWMRYASFLPDAVDNSPTASAPWYQQPLPMLRCSDILADYILAEFAFSRGSDQAKAIANCFWSDGKAKTRQYVNSTTMKIRQRINHRRRPYAQYRHQGWAWWIFIGVVILMQGMI